MFLLHHALQDTVTELKKKYHAVAKKYYPERQRLTLPAKPGQKSGDVLKDDSTLSSYGLTNGSVVQFKDLGTQVRTCRPPTWFMSRHPAAVCCLANILVCEQQAVGLLELQ
jgi:hypothetical protein